jgi:hypothetical protein
MLKGAIEVRVGLLSSLKMFLTAKILSKTAGSANAPRKAHIETLRLSDKDWDILKELEFQARHPTPALKALAQALPKELPTTREPGNE